MPIRRAFLAPGVTERDVAAGGWRCARCRERWTAVRASGALFRRGHARRAARDFL